VGNGSSIERSYTAGLYQVNSQVEDRRSVRVKGAFNSWLSCASDGLLAQFHNSNILNRFIPALDKPHVARYLAYYMSNYTSKHEATNLHLVEFMARKLSEYEMYKPETLEKKNDLFSGTLNKFSGSNNVGSVTAASLLLGFSDHYSGSEFTMINWKGWDIWFCKELGEQYRNHSYTRINSTSLFYRILSTGLGQNSNGVAIQESTKLVAFYEEYLARNEKLAGLSVYELQAQYQFQVVPKDSVTSDHYICNSPLNDQTGALLFCHAKRNRRHIPSLPGFNTRSKVHSVGTEAFSRLMLLLFRSFRSVADICTLHDINLKRDFKTYFDILNNESATKKILEAFIKDAEVSVEASNFEHPENPLDPALFLQLTEKGTIQWQAIRYHLSDSDQEVIVHQTDLDTHRTTASMKGRQLNPNESVYVLDRAGWAQKINRLRSPPKHVCTNGLASNSLPNTYWILSQEQILHHFVC
jgi:hypothetical protein